MPISLESMDSEPKLGGVVKIRFYFSHKIDILRDDGLMFGRPIRCNHKNDIIVKSLKNILNLRKLKTYFYNTYEFGSDVQCPLE